MSEKESEYKRRKRKEKMREGRQLSSLALGGAGIIITQGKQYHLFLSGSLLWSHLSNFPFELPQTRAEKGNLTSVFPKLTVLSFPFIHFHVYSG